MQFNGFPNMEGPRNGSFVGPASDRDGPLTSHTIETTPVAQDRM